jgi:hypothetical protein
MATKESAEKKVEATLTYGFLAKIFFFAGVAGGIVSAVAYLIMNLRTIAPLEAIVVLFAAPLLQGITLFVYSIVGYGVYKLLAQRRLLGLHEITLSK